MVKSQALSVLVPVVLQTAGLYIFLIAGVRLLGRRQKAELTIVELIIVMLLGSAVETALIAGDKSLVAGLVSAGTLLVCNRLFTLLARHSGWIHRTMIGRPVPLVYNGQLLEQRIRQAGLSVDDVREGLRIHGYDDPAQIKLAFLEIDGEISAVPYED